MRKRLNLERLLEGKKLAGKFILIDLFIKIRKLVAALWISLSHLISQAGRQKNSLSNYHCVPVIDPTKQIFDNFCWYFNEKKNFPGVLKLARSLKASSCSITFRIFARNFIFEMFRHETFLLLLFCLHVREKNQKRASINEADEVKQQKKRERE